MRSITLLEYFIFMHYVDVIYMSAGKGTHIPLLIFMHYVLHLNHFYAYTISLPKDNGGINIKISNSKYIIAKMS